MKFFFARTRDQNKTNAKKQSVFHSLNLQNEIQMVALFATDFTDSTDFSAGESIKIAQIKKNKCHLCNLNPDRQICESVA